MPTYKAEISVIYKNSECDRLEERSETVTFQEENDDTTVVKSALRHTTWYFKQMGDPYQLLYVGCIKIEEFEIGFIGLDGRMGHQRRRPILEWKCDVSSRFSAGCSICSSDRAELNVLLDGVKALNPTDWTVWEAKT